MIPPSTGLARLRIRWAGLWAATRAAAESALKESQEAKKESQESKESAKQTGVLVEKTLAQVEQLQALSGDLKAALGNVEPLRAAAEQTQVTARDNATESQRLLALAQVERKAADEALLRAEQTLQAVKTRAGAARCRPP